MAFRPIECKIFLIRQAGNLMQVAEILFVPTRRIFPTLVRVYFISLKMRINSSRASESVTRNNCSTCLSNSSRLEKFSSILN